MSVHNNCEILADFMKKRSQNKKTITRQCYKNRWFVLDSNFLSYYDGTPMKRGAKKGSICLEKIHVVEEVENLSLDQLINVLQIVYDEYAEYYTLYIVADTSKQRETWISSIRHECQKKNASFYLKYHPGVWTKSLKKYKCCDQIDRNAPGCKLSFVERHDEVPISPNKVSSSPSDTSESSNDKIYVAIYDYTPYDQRDLLLTTGERYEILNDSNEHWWLAKNRRGEKGYIPSNYVKKLCDLEIFDWYYKDITRQYCEMLLKKDGRDGCFMVRDSTTKGNIYTVSVFCKEKCRHYHIKETADGKFYLHEKNTFDTMADLIYYHKYNSAGLETRLRFPPSHEAKTVPATAGFGHDCWEISQSSLIKGKLVGSGCFGNVYEALWKSKIVAVKVMKLDTMSEDNFIEEAKTMTQLNHPNLVQLYGVVTKARPLAIILEYMQHGSLKQHLKKHKSLILYQSEKLIGFCMDVCKGMKYLESKNFVHRDLAARNCLVGSNYVVKVGDFGLTRYVINDLYNSSSCAKLPVKWASPEVFQFYRFSSKSDVWAFGVLMWEIFTCGDEPYADKSNTEVLELVCNSSSRLEKPPACPRDIYQEMRMCWKKNPDERYSFSTLRENLSDLLELFITQN
ncbi:tyrosine-protein kinase TXK-like isoform X1 [Argonauta hians]